MAEQEVEIVEEVPFDDGHIFLEGLRRILMAGIGAVVLAQEEIEEFINKLVDRGEIAEKDGRNLINDVRERRQDDAEVIPQEEVEQMESRVEGVLQRLNVPTKSEIVSLSKQIEELSKKVDQLKEISE